MKQNIMQISKVITLKNKKSDFYHENHFVDFKE
jgi:hypothetical protein